MSTGKRKPRKKKNLTAAECAQLPPEQWPSWYKPANGPGNGNPKHPDFAQNNTYALASGHRSPRVYNAVAGALVTGLLKDRPDLGKYPEALASWSDAQARAALLRKYLDEHGMADETGETRETMLRQLDRFERRADTARVRLGLDPRSEAELSLLIAKAEREGAMRQAVDLETLAERGRDVLDALEQDKDPVTAALDQARASGQAKEHTDD